MYENIQCVCTWRLAKTQRYPVTERHVPRDCTLNHYKSRQRLTHGGKTRHNQSTFAREGISPVSVRWMQWERVRPTHSLARSQGGCFWRVPGVVGCYVAGVHESVSNYLLLTKRFLCSLDGRARARREDKDRLVSDANLCVFGGVKGLCVDGYGWFGWRKIGRWVCVSVCLSVV